MALTRLVQLLGHSLLSDLRVQLSQLRRLIKFTDTRCSRWTPTFKFFCQPYKAHFFFNKTSTGQNSNQHSVVVLASLPRIHDLPDLHATMARREPSCRADGTGYIPFADESFVGHPQDSSRNSQLLVSEFSGRFTRCIFLRQGCFLHTPSSQFWLRASRSSHRFACCLKSLSEAMSRCQ